MRYAYSPEKVCSKKFIIEVDDETKKIISFEALGGCTGNLNGIARLIKGMDIDEVISRLKDNPICPSSKVTSCPEQLAKALIEMRAVMKGEKPAAPKMASPFNLGFFKK